MVLLDPLKLVVTTNIYVRRDLVQLTFLGTLLDFVPVFFIGSLHRLLSQLNRSLETSILFQTVRRRPIVKFHMFKVSMGVQLLHSRQSLALLQRNVGLDMNCVLLVPGLHLAVDILTHLHPHL